MKRIFNIAALLIASALLLFTGCHKTDELITDMNLARCLEPMNLKYRISEGKNVAFSWDVVKGCEDYTLTISTTPLTQENPAGSLVYDVTAHEVPFTVELQADCTYYFSVQALASSASQADSKWAIYDGKVETYAVKDPLNLTVTDRTSTSLSVSWDQDNDVTHITSYIIGAEGVNTYELTEDDVKNACATITGLTPSQNYVVTLYFNSASCGSLSLWTRPSADGATECSSTAAIQQAIADGASRIMVKASDTAYVIGAVDVGKPFEMYGEESVDGTKPVLKGELHILKTYTGGALYFESVEFNGAKNTYGFAIQLKNGDAGKDLAISSIKYKNCNITGYSKGLVYEWGGTMNLGELAWDACTIYDINADGTGGGDCIDFRGATTISKMSLTGNIIYTGMRTFVRFDAAVIPGDVIVTDNTIRNLCFVENTNNGGLFGVKVAPTGGIKFENNLLLNMVGKSSIIGPAASNLTASDAGLKCSNNWYYTVEDPATFFNEKVSQAEATAGGGQVLEGDPCYNSKGGIFNLLADSEAASAGVGAPQCRIPYEERPEDLTLTTITANKVWDFTDAKYFSGEVSKFKVRDNLFLGGGEETVLNFNEGVLCFPGESPLTRSGIPSEGYIAFQVDTAGSVLLKPVENGKAGDGHIVVAVGNTEGTTISIKGGAAVNTSMTTNQKILIKDIAEESLVYLYATGAIGLQNLSWSTDTTQVNTALATPEVEIDVQKVTQGDATPITVSWNKVSNAGSYSVVFNGKSYPVDGDSYIINESIIQYLDSGSYTVYVYANPGEDDIYNTQSSAGTASFAVLPKSGGGETELVVKTVDELKSAISAGKTAITLDAATFDLSQDAEWSGTLPVTGPLALKGRDGANVTGAVSISGEVGKVSIDNIAFTDCGKGCFITLLEAPAINADSLSITRCTLDGYSKSIIYGNFASSEIDKVSIIGNTIQNQGTGQGVFDFRKGTYAQIGIVGNTVIGGRDFIRIDSACSTSTVDVSNNTLDGVTLDNGNGVLYVRAAVDKYTVNRNLFLNEVKTAGKTYLSKATGVKVPTNMNANFYYNIDETSFLKGVIDSTTATFKGAILNDSPVKDLANHDYTLTNGVVIASKAGAFKWQPSTTYCDEEKITVNNAEEFKNALDAGKVEIILAAAGSPYTFGETTSFEIPANLHIVGESGSLPEFHGCFTMSGTDDLGTVIFDNIKFCGDGALGCLFTVSGTPTARNITVKNCTVDGFTKSVYYGSGAATVQALVFSGVSVENHGTGQGVFDIRKGACSSLTISNCTVTGGRDLIRADAGTVTDCFNFTNNTVYGSNVGVNSNGIMYVRATPTVYKFTNNLFLSEKAEGKTVILGKATGVTVPTAAGRNFVWDYDETNFFTAPFTREATGFSTLSYCPVKDAANGDYTLTDALCLSSNIGALKWNPNRGRVTTDITVTSLEEFINALNAGKTAISVKADTINFKAAPAEATAFASGVLSLSSSLTVAGIKTYGKDPVIKGGFKFNTGVESFVAQNLVFDGEGNTIGNLFEVAGALETSKIIVRNCEIKEYNKSVFYGNAEGNVGSASFSRLLVHDMGTGQGMFDCRKKVYGSIVLENSTIYNGGRDLIRCDAGVGQSLCVRNNTLSNTGIGAGNGLLWVRIDVGDQYVVENNLFLNETGTTLLAKTGAKKAVFKNNHYFNLGESFWTGTYTLEEGTANGGSVLEADPCTNSANGEFKLTNQDLKKLGVGDSRWR